MHAYMRNDAQRPFHLDLAWHTHTSISCVYEHTQTHTRARVNTIEWIYAYIHTNIPIYTQEKHTHTHTHTDRKHGCALSASWFAWTSPGWHRFRATFDVPGRGCDSASPRTAVVQVTKLAAYIHIYIYTYTHQASVSHDSLSCLSGCAGSSHHTTHHHTTTPPHLPGIKTIN